MKITFSAFKGVQNFISAIQLATSKAELNQFITKRRYLHFGVTSLIMLLPFIGLSAILYCWTDGAFNYVCSIIAKVFLIGFWSWFTNMRWETFHSSRGNIYDEVDVTTGILGGFFVVLVGEIILITT